jgi:Holliday junction resolvase RusA-like endonuclease
VPQADPMPADVKVVLPWVVLVSDNLRKGLVKEAWRKYKTGRDAAHALALCQVTGKRPRYTEPVTVEVLLWLPNDRRRDPTNILKASLDALSGVAYDDDKRIRSLAWLVMGVDRQNPRAEITVMAGTYRATWAKEPDHDTGRDGSGEGSIQGKTAGQA